MAWSWQTEVRVPARVNNQDFSKTGARRRISVVREKYNLAVAVVVVIVFHDVHGRGM